MNRYASLCDRCGAEFRSPRFPNEAVCRPCLLGALSTVDRIVALVGGAR